MNLVQEADSLLDSAGCDIPPAGTRLRAHRCRGCSELGRRRLRAAAFLHLLSSSLAYVFL